MRTIDADALGDAFSEKEDRNPIDGNGGYLSIEEIYETIDNAPTVEQPTDEWIINTVSPYEEPWEQECSKCHLVLKEHLGAVRLNNYSCVNFNYCPNCGAKMKGGEEE